MTDKPVVEKLETNVPVEPPKLKAVSVSVKAVWKKPKKEYTLVQSPDGNYYLVKNYQGQTSFTDEELKKFKRPYPFANAISKVLPSPEEMEKELYRTGVVEPEDMNLAVAKIMVNKILDSLEPVKILRLISDLILR